MADSIEVKLAELSARIGSLEEQVRRLLDKDEMTVELRVELGKLQSQIKITWVLLMLVIGGLVTVAFSLLWNGM